MAAERHLNKFILGQLRLPFGSAPQAVSNDIAIHIYIYDLEATWQCQLLLILDHSHNAIHMQAEILHPRL